MENPYASYLVQEEQTTTSRLSFEEDIELQSGLYFFAYEGSWHESEQLPSLELSQPLLLPTYSTMTVKEIAELGLPIPFVFIEWMRRRTLNILVFVHTTTEVNTQNGDIYRICYAVIDDISKNIPSKWPAMTIKQPDADTSSKINPFAEDIHDTQIPTQNIFEAFTKSCTHKLNLLFGRKID